MVLKGRTSEPEFSNRAFWAQRILARNVGGAGVVSQVAALTDWVLQLLEKLSLPSVRRRPQMF